MFVQSLSWQNDRFYIQMAPKCRFSQDTHTHTHNQGLFCVCFPQAGHSPIPPEKFKWSKSKK